MTHASPPFHLPRALIFLASLWLIASWLLAIGMKPPVHPASSSYEPGVRSMLLSIMMGLLVAWPLLRLSQRASPYPLRQTVLDITALLAMVQVVLWPLRLVTTWTPLRTAAIDATIGLWLCLVGAAVAAAVGAERPGPRVLAMTACILIGLVGPMVAWAGIPVGVAGDSWIALSPFMAVRTLADSSTGILQRADWYWLLVLAGANLAAWTGTIVLLHRVRHDASVGHTAQSAP